MAPRPLVALAVGALACAALAGCGGGTDAGPTTATPSEYIAAVQRLVEPPAQLASSLEERGRAVTGPAPAKRRLDRIVSAARDRLEEFRGLRPGDPALRRQRDRLAGAYARMIPRMRSVVRSKVSRLQSIGPALWAPALNPILRPCSAANPTIATPSSADSG